MKWYCPLFLLLFSLFLFSSCQSFPTGDRLDDIADPELSTLDLYRYFTMCRVTWRIRDQWRRTGWDLDYIYDERTNTLAMAVVEEGVLHIAFRSSQALEEDTDLKYNSRIALRKVPFLEDTRIRAHRGFLTKYSSIREELASRVETYGVRKVMLLGHSGGGAMASITYLDFSHRFPDLELEAILFGPVRTFNRHGARWFSDHEDRVIRIVNGRDFFSNVPPTLFGYRHIGRLVRIGRRPVYKIFSFKDHHPGYRTVLEGLLREEGIDPETLDFY